MDQLRGLYIADQATFELVYVPQHQRAISRHVDIIAPPQTRDSILENPSLLGSVDVIFSSWTPPRFDDAFFDKAPRLRAIFYAAGALNVSEIAWRRGIQVTTAQVANSQPVAEYALATILFSLKHGWRLARETRERRTFVERNNAPGCYKTTVGLVSLGIVARSLLKLLAPFDLNVLVYDPFLTEAEAIELNVEKVTLEELFDRSDAISLHTPLKPETVGMITGEHLGSMKQGATFINTARGSIVREEELIRVAKERPDVQFILDVTDPQEPPLRDCPLYDLPNVVLTPHIAGSAGGECRRMGQCMVEELERFVEGKPLKWSIAPQPASVVAARRTANRSVRASTFVRNTSNLAPQIERLARAD